MILFLYIATYKFNEGKIRGKIMKKKRKLVRKGFVLQLIARVLALMFVLGVIFYIFS